MHEFTRHARFLTPSHLATLKVFGPAALAPRLLVGVLSWDTSRVLFFDGTRLRMVPRFEAVAFAPGELPVWVVKRHPMPNARLVIDLAPLRFYFSLRNDTYGRDWVVVVAASLDEAKALASSVFSGARPITLGEVLS
ncbi:hypothetical protein [Corallococcus terminator]|uniref:hypothetical protein n=1 Tax=Corallococcus terminator TaxID=2316733 RepID=UPI0011C4287A|nr:hypothetical protein [Corallococcus terminator]